MNQLKSLGIIDAFDEHRIIGLEITAFIRVSEMNPNNPLLKLYNF